jgi:hypothetical protein
MKNLTRELRVVTDAVDLSPVPGRELVVFKRVRGGLKLVGSTKAGEAFERPLPSSPGSYVAFAVSRDRRLRHRFTRLSQTSGQGRTFATHITLLFTVGDSVLVVRELESDPMRRIEELTGSLLGSSARHVDPSFLQEEAEPLPGFSLRVGMLDFQGQEVSLFEQIRSFSAQLGIDIVDVRVERLQTAEALQAGSVLRRRGEPWPGSGGPRDRSTPGLPLASAESGEVVASTGAFLDRRGSVKVGRGSVVRDIRKARTFRGAAGR